jgi:hypothetical protein
MTANTTSPHIFYLWRHRFVDDDTDAIITRTCFGITSDLDKRQNSYEGHVGHAIKWSRLWQGPERQIRELEHRLNATFRDYLFSGHKDFVYEWVDETIPFEDIKNWVEWEVENTFADITVTEEIK